MQNTASITQENWLDLGKTENPVRTSCHFAIRQKGVNLDFHLHQFFRDRTVSFHFFDTFQELVTICHRFPVDTIVIAGRNEFLRELDLVRMIKDNILLSIVPVILYHPDPDVNIQVAAYEAGVDDFIYGEWIDQLVKVRVARVIDRSHRDLAVNPSTRLPGPTLIEREINRQLEMGEQFAVCYADLDNFKAYNDYYGYVYGDRVIRLTGRILRDVVFDLCREGFVGHIAGDDYVFVIPGDAVPLACDWVIRSFDSFIPYCYDQEDRERGHIETANRAGDMERYGILTLSIAVIVNRNNEFRHMGELSKQLADLKKATKSLEGSNYMVERRRKY